MWILANSGSRDDISVIVRRHTRAERAAATVKQVRGLEFRKYISIQKAMTEGELLGIAGEPDLKADPFTTTITLVGGRVSEIERVRTF